MNRVTGSSQRVFIFAFILLVMGGGFVFLSWGQKNDPILLPYLPQGSYLPVVRIGEAGVKVYVANTPETHQRGLSIFDTLPPGTGMFFIFDKDDVYGIWMKDMKFAIDIIWVDAEGRIVDMREHATPESYPHVFTPRAPARYVLEVVSGFIEQRSITPADFVDFSGVL